MYDISRTVGHKINGEAQLPVARQLLSHTETCFARVSDIATPVNRARNICSLGLTTFHTSQPIVYLTAVMASSGNTNNIPSTNDISVADDSGRDRDPEKILATWKAMAESYERETARLVAERLAREKKEADSNGVTKQTG